MMKRQAIYLEQEKIARERYRQAVGCCGECGGDK